MFQKIINLLLKNRFQLIPHYIYDDNKRISISQRVRALWCLDEYNKEYILKHNSNVKDNRYNQNPVRIICGEFSSAHTTEFALEQGYEVELICGADIFNDTMREKLASLKDEYATAIRVYVYGNGMDKRRPKYHSVLIGKNLFFEDMHETSLDGTSSYEYANIIENASMFTINMYNKLFSNYLSESKEMLNADNIRALPLLMKTI